MAHWILRSLLLPYESSSLVYPSQEAQCAFLSTLLQTWLWPYKNSPTAYGQYLVLDRIYPFADPERLLSLVEMLETENVPYVLCVMPIYANADYPAMKRFCEVLRYAQSRGAGIVMHVPQVTLANVTVEGLQENIANAYSAYSRYGVYPLAIEAPDVWLMSEKGHNIAYPPPKVRPPTRAKVQNRSSNSLIVKVLPSFLGI